MLETYCLDGILISIFIFCILCAFSISYKAQPITRPPFIIHIIIVLFCAYAFWDQDYYGYLESLKLIDLRFPNAEQQTHLEPLYVWIGYFVDGNYTMFRLCIWIVSYILFLKTLQNWDICSKQSIALFIVYFLLTFSYARVSLGMVSLFYGVSLLLKPNKKFILNICLGLAMFLLAYNAHKSMFVAIVVLPFIFLRLNKYTLVIATAIIIVATVLVGGDTMSDMLIANTVNDEYGELIQESMENYLTSDTTDKGITAQLLSIMQITSLILPIIYCYTNTTISKYLSTNRTLRCFVNYSTFLILIGISLGLVLSFNSPISYRLIFMAYIPNIIIICTLYKNSMLSKKAYNRFFFLFTIYSALRLSYTLYNQLVS